MGMLDTDSGPAYRFRAVTPNDSADLALGECRSLWVGTGGNVAVHDETGAAVTFSNVPTGSYLYIHTKRVLLTNTTASGIVALY